MRFSRFPGFKIYGRVNLSWSLSFGVCICFFFMLTGILSCFWTPYPVNEQSIQERFQGISAAHWLGTDAYGRDLLSMLIGGVGNSLLVSLGAVGLGLILGVPSGLIAAARSGWIDDILARLSDLIFAFPSLLIAILLAAYWGPGNINSIIAIGIFNVPVFARLTRNSACLLWVLPFVQLAVTLGKSRAAISIQHILPNLMTLLIVQCTTQSGLSLLAEAGLSFLGLGTQPPEPSLGKMLKEGQTLMYLAPHLAIVPGCVIMLMVMGVNLLGDGIRNVLDPKLSLKAV